jgi:5'-3' exonuclease
MAHNRVLIVDGLNTFIRNFCVNPTMDSNGTHVGGMLGCLRSIKNLIRDTKCTKAIVVWDGKGGSRKRRGIYSEYKAGRKPRMNRHLQMDSVEESQKNLWEQHALTRKYLEMLGVCQIEVDECEADDIISVLCYSVYDQVQKVIVSTDQDFFQLVNADTIVYSPVRKLYYGASEIKEETGVLACNHIYIKAICGDRSDNVKGIGDVANIKGLGEKTVVKFFPFLGEHESSLEEIKQAAQVLAPTGRREKELLKALLEHWDVIITNVRLMQLANPIISPQSVHSIRHQVEKDQAVVNASAIKLALLRDNIQIHDQDFFMVFNEYRGRFAAGIREDSSNV